MSDTSDPRPHAWQHVRGLDGRPLDAGGVSGVQQLRTTTSGPIEHEARTSCFVVTLEDGREPEIEGPVLPFAPRHAEPLAQEESAAVAFEWDGSVLRAQIELPLGTSYYGLGERAGPLERGGREHQLWNTDAWCYADSSPALYQSHPFVLAILPCGAAVGLVADTPARGRIATVEDGVEFAFEGEPYLVHRIEAAHPAGVLRALAAMIGAIELPPLWALGYHQCRWSYTSAEEVRELAREFRRRALPCDAVWLDIDYMDRFRVFTFDAERFPDPAGLVRELESSGLHTVAILDPGLPRDHPLTAEALREGHFVEGADGRPVAGRVWPGLCHFPDFTLESVRAWWAAQVQAFVESSGMSGLWNDMNEPSVFRVPAGTLPDDAVHRGLGGGTHARFHNLYGQLMAEATLAGLRAARPERRPFVLTRANHLAGSRFAATWTGDNQARWEDLAWSIPMVLNLGLSGQPFSGPDVGGFYGDPDEELFVRWFELGAWLPFFRGHSEKTSCRKEPWAFGERALQLVRQSLETRMRLLPMLYTLFEHAARTGEPIARPVCFADPSDPQLRAIDDCFLFGDDLLVAPVVQRGHLTRTLRLPRNPGGWFAFDVSLGPDLDSSLDSNGERPSMDPSLESSRERLQRAPHFEGGAIIEVPAPLGTTPVFARAGSILVSAPSRLDTTEPDDLRIWHVFPDDSGQACGRTYEDTGEGFEHRRGASLETEVRSWTEAGTPRFAREDRGDWRPAARRQLVLHYTPD